MKKNIEKQTALVLGGGAARGIAHIGVLKVLKRHKIPVDMVVGTSIGSIMGAAYALGIPLKNIEKVALRTTWKDLADFVLSKTGFLEGRNLEKIIREVIENKGFEDLKMPLAVVATDIENGEEVVITSGDLVRSIRASCSIPGIFIPMRIDGRMLVDGGLRSTVPSEAAKRMGAAFVIAIDVGYCVRKGKITNIFQVLFQSTQIIGNELNKHERRPSDVVIEVPLGEDMHQMAFDRAAEIISIGEKAAEIAMPALLAKMKKLLT
jgi:NTE family protein